MAVFFKVQRYLYSVGTGDFLFAFFSTVAVRLENGRWGSRFPAIMRELYQGELPVSHLEKAESELMRIQKLLQALPVTDVVWDFHDQKKRPIWEGIIDRDIRNLADFFITNSGADLFDNLFHAIRHAESVQESVRIESYLLEDTEFRESK